MSKSLLKWLAVVLWLAGIAGGLCYAWKYETSPAKSGAARDRWPAGSSCTLAPDRPTLVMFVHPHCPCSRATLQELTALLTHCRDRLNVQVLFFRPPSAPSEWTRTDLWETVAALPGVVPRVDSAGAEQRRFGASVSGEVFVYLPGGELLFHGGITSARGHVGDNLARSALESYLLRGETPPQSMPVFGCELYSPNASCSAPAATSGSEQDP